MSDIVPKLLSLLGGQPVLLPIEPKVKGPFFDGWQRLSWSCTQDPEHMLEWCKKDPDTDEKRVVRRARYADELCACAERGGNIGVLLGGGLAAIDIDHDEEVEPFLKLNPALRKTLITKGSRGVQIWVRCIEDADTVAHGLPYCPKLYPIKSKRRKWAGKNEGESDSWGEWRAATQGGAQSVIWGVHPNGQRYQFVNEAPVKEVVFRDICWPEHLLQPWQSDYWLGLVERYGPPWTVKEGQVDEPTEACWAARVATQHYLLYEATEERFYRYDPTDGCWKRRSENEVKALISDELMVASRDPVLQELACTGWESREANWRRLDKQDGILAVLQTNKFRSNGRLSSIMHLLKGLVARRDVFLHQTGLVHVANGMIDLRPMTETGGRPKRLSFSPRWYSRNQIPVQFEQGAQCHELLTRLLEPGYTRDEIQMIQRWFGQCLLANNKQQVMMIVVGNAGGGKSTTMKLFQKFIGEENVMELRTSQLDERFEMAFYIGRTFLSGVDVDGNFLSHGPASALKKLTGDDLLHAEVKGAKDAVPFRGNFNIGISCNSKLKVRLKSDHDAWRRRLCIARCNAPRPKERIEQLERWLIEKEGPGILNWGLAGAVEVLQGKPIRHSEALDRVVDDLISESDSVKVFCSARIRKERGCSITSKALYGAYIDFCEEREWEALGENEFARAARGVMSELFQASQSSSVEDPETKRACKGYRGVVLQDAGEACPHDNSGSEGAAAGEEAPF